MEAPQKSDLKAISVDPSVILYTDKGPRPAREVKPGAKLHGPQGFMEVLDVEVFDDHAFEVEAPTGKAVIGKDTHLACLGKGGFIYWKLPSKISGRDLPLQPLIPWKEERGDLFVKGSEGALADPRLKPEHAIYLPLGERILYLVRFFKDRSVRGRTNGFSFIPEGDLGPEFKVYFSEVEKEVLHSLSVFSITVGARAVPQDGGFLLKVWGPLANLFAKFAFPGDSPDGLGEPSQGDIEDALRDQSYLLLPTQVVNVLDMGKTSLVKISFASGGSVQANGFLLLVR